MKMCKCKYWETCKGYRPNSSTCNDGNKSYCGIFRNKEREKHFKKKYVDQKQ